MMDPSTLPVCRNSLALCTKVVQHVLWLKPHSFVSCATAVSLVCQVVPTYYQDINGGLLRTNQFSVTEHVKDVDLRTGKNMPGVFFFYDINPIQVCIIICVCPLRWCDGSGGFRRNVCAAALTACRPPRVHQVRFTETKSTFLHFLTSVCAIIGGVFTVSVRQRISPHRCSRSARRRDGQRS